MSYLKKIIFALFLLSLFQCKKDEPVEAEPENIWKLHESFLYEDKIQVNSYASDDSLYFMGQNQFSSLFIDGQSGTEEQVIHYSTYAYPTEYKPPISSLFYPLVNAHTGIVTFYSTPNPVFAGTMTSVNLSQFDSSFVAFEYPSWFTSEGALINDRNQCLVGYRDDDGTIGISLMIAEIAVDYEFGIPNLEVVSTSKITGNFELQWLISLHSIDEYFFVTGDHTFRISPDLEFETVFEDRFYKIFKYDNKIYGVTRDEIYVSTNQGLDWQKLIEVVFDTFATISQFSFYDIDEHLIATRNSQLFEFDFTDTTLEIKEILNTGLEGNEITSLALFNDKVYVSTLSGLFEKELDMFLEYKE